MTVHHIAKGTVIVVPEGAWRNGTGELRLRVQRVMHELNSHTPGWLWVEGVRLGNEHGHNRWLQALVRIDALPKGPHRTSN